MNEMSGDGFEDSAGSGSFKFDYRRTSAEPDPGEVFSLPCGPDDVKRIYWLFLGRAPESAAVITGNCNRPLADMIRSTIFSAEFAKLINDVATAARGGPVNFTNAITADIEDWLVHKFGVRPKREAGSLDARWREQLASLIGTWRVWEMFAKAFGRQAQRLYESLTAKTDTLAEWRGNIDQASVDNIKGWLFSESAKGPIKIELFANGVFIGIAENSEFRWDVAKAHNIVGGCGFSLRPALSPLHINQPSLAITARRLGSGEELPLKAEIKPAGTQRLSQLLALREELEELSSKLDDCFKRFGPLDSLVSFPTDRYDRFKSMYRVPEPPPHTASRKLSVVVPVYRPPRKSLAGAIRSVKEQSHGNWQLVLVNDAPDDIETLDYIRQLALADPRITVITPYENLGLAGALNAGIEAATGDYVCFLDHDDELEPTALAWCGHVIAETGAKLVYSDEDRFEYEGGRKKYLHPFFKPARDYDLLLQRNYVCHLVCVEAATLRMAGGLRKGFEGAQDHDLALRLFEILKPSEIMHLPYILYHWQIAPTSFSNSKENQASIEVNGRKAVAEHLLRMNCSAEASMHDDRFGDPIEFCSRVDWKPAPEIKRMAIIIQTRDRVDYLAPCIESIRQNLARPSHCDIVVVNNRSQKILTEQYLRAASNAGDVRVIDFDEDFNWSRANNVAASLTDADFLLFMNNDMVVLTYGFDDTVRALLDRPEVGMVGARLLYENGTIQHAGVAIGVGGVGGHIGVGDPVSEPGYFDLTHLDHAVSAVTGAFMAVRKRDHLAVGGFDEHELKVAFNDVDYSLKVHGIGKVCVYTPKITCYHFESVTRGYDYIDPDKTVRANNEAEVVKYRWNEDLLYDLFYNITFDRKAMPFQLIAMPSADQATQYLQRQLAWQRKADAFARPLAG